MTNATWLSELIESKFSVSDSPVAGEGVIRSELPQEPRVVVAGECDDRSRMVDARTPTIIVTGENENQQARSVGYRDKKVESRLSIEIVLTGGREKLFGRVSEDYGGYAGEVERIIDSVRIGPAPIDDDEVDTAEYDYVEFDQLSDEVERYGAELFGGEWTVTFINEAKSILQ